MESSWIDFDGKQINSITAGRAEYELITYPGRRVATAHESLGRNCQAGGHRVAPIERLNVKIEADLFE
jgi:hypothetical protein